MKADEKRLRILEAINRLQGDSGSYVNDASITEELGLPAGLPHYRYSNFLQNL